MASYVALSNTGTNFSDQDLANVGDVSLDSISPDGTDINVALSDNSATALTMKQGSDAYLIVDTANSSESVAIGTGISGTAISIGHATSETTVNDNLSVTGTLNVSSGIEVTSAEADTVTATGGGAVTSGSVSQSDRKGVVTIDLATNSCNIADDSAYTLVVVNARCDADSVVAATVSATNVTHSTSTLSGSGFRIHISNATGSAITSNFTVNYIVL
jgi:hypothetical protein